MPNLSLGEEIRIVRQKSFYSQEAFAKELHVALSTVNRWEMNRICPNLSAMKSINEFCSQHNLEFGNVEQEWLRVKLNK